MKYLNKLGFATFAAITGLVLMTGCEGADLYEVDSPDWIAQRVDSIAAEKNKGGEEVIEGLMEDVYTIGATDYTTGWWAQFSKYYQIPDGEKWYAQFNLNINPSASNTYKNFALILCSDADRGSGEYIEYGAIRYDNQPSGNSEWGDYINRDNVESTLTFATDTDEGVGKLGGLVTLSIDRTDPNNFIVNITNGTVTKTYTHKHALENLNADPANTTIRAFLVPEGSYIGWLKTTIEPIGGCTSAEDKQPLELILANVPKKVMLGTELKDALANVTATVNFETGVSKTVPATDLVFQTIPDMNGLGKKTLIAIYNKTYKGENCNTPVMTTAEFDVVDKMYSSLGATDNSTGWWGAHSENIKVGPGETFVSQFTNYSSCGANWNNFVTVLVKEDNTEYAVVRADNYGWGAGYDACTTYSDAANDWDTWRAAMDGAKVTTYVTNNGDGTADVKAVMLGNNGETYVQEYNGINGIDPDDFWFRFTVDGCHLEFDNVLGADDNTTGWWGAHSENILVPAGTSYSVRFTNYTTCGANWNNFVTVLVKEDNTEYAVVRADNYGWGAGYDACTTYSDAANDWDTWRAAMDGARVTVTVTNLGNGTANVKAVMECTDGETYVQEYNGINGIDPDDFWFRFTVDGCHLVFE